MGDSYTLDKLSDREIQIKKELDRLNKELHEIAGMKYTFQLANIKSQIQGDDKYKEGTYGSAKMYLTHF